MGGLGSGDHPHLDAKRTTSRFLALDVRRCARDGALEPGSAKTYVWEFRDDRRTTVDMYAEQNQVVLSYVHPERDFETTIDIIQTPCHLGGTRAWFLCPTDGCGRRVAVVYLNRVFACRHCHALAYESTRAVLIQRQLNRLNEIRRRLGWPPGLSNFRGERPKWMRWKTFVYLIAERLNAERVVIQTLMKKIDLR